MLRSSTSRYSIRRRKAVAAGIDNILLVPVAASTRSRSFDSPSELESFLEARGKRQQLDEVRKILKLINFGTSARARRSVWATPF